MTTSHLGVVTELQVNLHSEGSSSKLTGNLEVVTELQNNLHSESCSARLTPQSSLRLPNAQSIYSVTPVSYRSAFSAFYTASDDSTEMDGGPADLSPISEISVDVSEDCNDVSKDDIVIAVMGPTGAGKSTFVNVATGSESVRVGHNLKSCTAEVQIIRCKDPKYPERDIVFVDTPGFDDTYKNDTEILETIASWLKNTYSKGVTLSGILFFHRITDNRISNTVLRNLTMFQQLCGDKALKNVIFVTTQWDLLQDTEEGVLRENELRQKHWKPFIENGCQVRRFQYTCASAWNIINAIRRAYRPLKIQKEMVDQRLPLPETSAGSALFSWLTVTTKSLKKLVKGLERVLKKLSTGDEEILQHSLKEDLLANRTKLSLIKEQLRRFRRRKSGREPLASSGSSTASSSSSPSLRYILVEKIMGKTRDTPAVARDPITTDLESDGSSITSTEISFTIVDVSDDARNDEGLASHQSQSHGLTYALQSLTLAKAAVTGLPVPGLQSAVSVALRITELLNNTRNTQDSLVNLMRDANQLIEVITQDVRHVQGEYPQDIISAIEEFARELRKLTNIAQRIKAAQSNFVTRYILQPEDERAIANCNEAMKLSLHRLQIQLGLTAVAQNEALRKGFERLEKHIEKLNTSQCDCQIRGAVFNPS